METDARMAVTPDSGIMSAATDFGDSVAENCLINFEQLQNIENDAEKENEKYETEMLDQNQERAQKFDMNDAYKKMHILLKKSNIFADLILNKMKKEHEQTLRHYQKVEKAVEQAKHEPAEQRNTSSKVLRSRSHTIRQAAIPQRPTWKRKANNAAESLSRHFNEEELIAKKAEASDETVDYRKQTLSTENVAFECDLKYFTGGSMRDYQIEGLCWLKTQYEQGINGILADEMGLGKTIQCIALFSHFYAQRVAGPFLVICPLSTLPNWSMEFNRFSPKLPCVLYHGNKEERTELRKKIKKGSDLDGLQVRPVILTSYEIFMNDRVLLNHFGIRYLVIDEGHRVKNNKCKLLRDLRHLKCSRLLMTGTPLQNNLAELWSLLNFLLPEIFNDLDWFENLFIFQSIDKSKHEDEERERQMLSKLHSILKPFLLRRLKTDVELQLPPKKEVWVYTPMTSDQLAMYKATIDRCILSMCGIETKEQAKLNKPITGKRKSIMRPETWFDEDELSEQVDSFENSIRCIRNPIMLLRKICLHPYMFQYPLTKDLEYQIDNQLIFKSGKLMVFDQLITALIKNDHKVLVFSQFTSLLDILHDYCYLKGLSFNRLDGRMKWEDRAEQIKCFADDKETRIFLISTKAGGLGLNLVSADTVIIFDSDWNPQGDLQAQDRCHRIGQTKHVVVYRLICRGTIDEAIVECASKKRKLEKMVIQKGRFHLPGSKTCQNGMISNEELVNIVKSTDYNHIWEIDSDRVNEKSTQLISTANLKKLLDRGLTEHSADDVKENRTFSVREDFVSQPF